VDGNLASVSSDKMYQPFTKSILVDKDMSRS